MSAHHIIPAIYFLGSASIFAVSILNAIKNVNYGASIAVLIMIGSLVSPTMPFCLEMLEASRIRENYIAEIRRLDSPKPASSRGAAADAFALREQFRQAYRNQAPPLAWAITASRNVPKYTFEDIIERHVKRFEDQYGRKSNERDMPEVYRTISTSLTRPPHQITASTILYKHIAIVLIILNLVTTLVTISVNVRLGIHKDGASWNKTFSQLFTQVGPTVACTLLTFYGAVLAKRSSKMETSIPKPIDLEQSKKPVTPPESRGNSSSRTSSNKRGAANDTSRGSGSVNPNLEDEYEDTENDLDRNLEVTRINHSGILGKVVLRWIVRGLKESKRRLLKSLLSFILPSDRFDTCRRWFDSIWSLVAVSEPRPGYTRMHYTCQCGQKLYDNYTVSHPDTLDDLRNLLQKSGFVVNSPGDLEANRSAAIIPTSAQTGQNSITPQKRTDFSSFFSRKQSHDPDSGSLTKPTNSREKEKPNFVLTCVPFGRLIYTLHQPKVWTLTSDQDFFSLLKSTYREGRTKRRLWFLRKVNFVHFVRFEMFLPDRADIRKQPDLPSGAMRNQYIYDTPPDDNAAPLESNLLLHCFENPTHANENQHLFNRIPKKFQQELSPSAQTGSSIGWGLALVEGADPFMFCLCGFVGFMICLSVSLAWTAAKDDIQGGFGIGGFVLTFWLFCLGLVHTFETTRG